MLRICAAALLAMVLFSGAMVEAQEMRETAPPAWEMVPVEAESGPIDNPEPKPAEEAGGGDPWCLHKLYEDEGTGNTESENAGNDLIEPAGGLWDILRTIAALCRIWPLRTSSWRAGTGVEILRSLI